VELLELLVVAEVACGDAVEGVPGADAGLVAVAGVAAHTRVRATRLAVAECFPFR
jgi:hypothetical protein